MYTINVAYFLCRFDRRGKRVVDKYFDIQEDTFA